MIAQTKCLMYHCTNRDTAFNSLIHDSCPSFANYFINEISLKNFVFLYYV